MLPEKRMFCLILVVGLLEFIWSFVNALLKSGGKLLCCFVSPGKVKLIIYDFTVIKWKLFYNH